MTTFLIVRGGEIELSEEESYNKVRQRLGRAKKNVLDYQNGNIDGVTKGSEGNESQIFEPFMLLSFKTADEGRCCFDPDDVIGCRSDVPTDQTEEQREQSRENMSRIRGRSR
jgi:hypothetical protein